MGGFLMRSMTGLTIIVALMLPPLKCFAQPPVSQSNSSQRSTTQAKQGTPPKVEVFLRNGQRLKGRSYGLMCGQDCYTCRQDFASCRVEIVQKGATQTIACRDILRMEVQRTFWKEVGHVAENAAGTVLFVPGMLLLMIFCRSDCEL